MLVLSLILLNDGQQIPEPKLFSEMEQMGDTVNNVKEITKRMVQQGYVLRRKTKKVDANDLPIYALFWGPKADLEIGKRWVVNWCCLFVCCLLILWY